METTSRIGLDSNEIVSTSPIIDDIIHVQDDVDDEVLLSNDSDSDYSPKNDRTISKSRKKSKKRRRLRSGNTSFTRTESIENINEENIDEESNENTISTQYKSKGTGDQNWVDDGCTSLFVQRLRDHEKMIRFHIETKTSCFYMNYAIERKNSASLNEVMNEFTSTMNEFEDEDINEDVNEGNVEEAKSEVINTVPYTIEDTYLTESGLDVPQYIYQHLYPHQRECLDWLHHLHERNTGGILGDEMGLGKTIQIVAFLGAMQHSQQVRLALLLSPASVLLNWVREFHKWYPQFRIILLHASGSGMAKDGRTIEELLHEVAPETSGPAIVISTYENFRLNQELFLPVYWDYVILDEGHRIRNPDAEITLVCKQLQTVHRIILTGTPIQNRLRELWSLFDFVYPGKLGILPTFEDEFVLPIRTGGYANASRMQVLMAYKCALSLKELINPFMLRRTKAEIQAITKMPNKMEQILFCELAPAQRQAYEKFLRSSEVSAVLRNEIRPFRAISILRHICNHPDLVDSAHILNDDEDDSPLNNQVFDYGSPEHSGKMIVMENILKLWKRQGHRVLLFSQTRKMLDILCARMKRLSLTYCRLDGTTNVKERQRLLDAFNAPGSDIFIFMLTTRAGGIGVNLTGANRVIIFDPDWNPSTDVQARERAWRLGQEKPVTVYRLITSGTIEEKIYHRQLFKQYLTSKVLHDAKRKRCFNKKTLRELFILDDSNENGKVETTQLHLAGQVERPDDEHDSDEKTEGYNDDNAILRQLFDGGNVRSVFNHDVIEKEGIQNQEADLIEMESTKIAQSAVNALKSSCAQVLQQRESLFTPTWTGRMGSAGNPTQIQHTGYQLTFRNRSRQPSISTPAQSRNPFLSSAMSSKAILSKLKARRNGISRVPKLKRKSRDRNVEVEESTLDPEDMTKRLHAFLLQQQQYSDGVPTETLLDAFANVVVPADKLIFRNILREIATCRGHKWRLKEEFAVKISQI